MHFRQLLILGLGLGLGAHGLPQGTNPGKLGIQHWGKSNFTDKQHLEAGGAALAADNRDPDQGYVGAGSGYGKREDADQGYVGAGAAAGYHDPNNVGAAKRNGEDKPDQDQGYVGLSSSHGQGYARAAKRNDEDKPDQDQGYVGYGKREDADQGYVGV